MDEVYPPDWERNSIVVSGQVNAELELGKFHPNANDLEWVGKKSNQEKSNVNNSQASGSTNDSKEEITVQTTTLRYADIVKQNVDKAPQTKNSNASFNSYKGTFQVAVKEPKKTKSQNQKPTPTQPEQPLVNPSN